MTTVWAHIEEELHKRRMNAAWLGRKLGASRQVISGWKIRGVPASRYEDIATLFGWTIDRLINGFFDESPTPANDPVDDPFIDFSPVAMDVARLFDEIDSELNRAKAYAFVTQLSKGHAAPAGPTTPIAPVPVSPAPQTRPSPRSVK